MGKVNVGILGTGNIGTDLLMKVMRSKKLNCALFAGRNTKSRGMQVAQGLGVKVTAQGIDAFAENPNLCDIIFDATSASAHIDNLPTLSKLGAFIIDMTPAHFGDFCIPWISFL